MRILLMGSPIEVVPVIEELCRLEKAGVLHLVAVVTPVPQPSGRGRAKSEVPLALAAKSREIQLLQPIQCSSQEFISWMIEAKVDLVLTAAYGQILSSAFLAAPKRGVLNIHPSLLPKYRGPTPVPAAILDHETQTGVTVLFTALSVDSGALIAQAIRPLRGDERSQALTKELFALGASLLAEVFEKLKNPDFQGQAQDAALASKCRKIHKSDGQLDWSKSARDLFAEARAYDVWPGSFSFFRGKRISIEIESTVDFPQVSPEDPGAFSYEPSRDAILVKTGVGGVLVKSLKTEGRAWVSASAFWNGVHKQLPLIFENRIEG